MKLKRLFRPSGKNLHFTYILASILRDLEPDFSLERKIFRFQHLEKAFPEYFLLDRLNYHCRLEHFQTLGDETRLLSEISMQEDNYARDFKEYGRFFNKNLKVATYFGDRTDTPEYPAFAKSRPISGDNHNSVLLNLDKIRHFTFVEDNRSFTSKINKAIFRAGMYQSHRIRFMEKFFDSDIVDCGHVGGDIGHPEWHKPKISLYAHLPYKFIICLEGNDVASNLKWVMHSNSIAVMPKPKYETWFMEGRLLPNVHYIEIKDDYSDLEEKLAFYSSHLEESQAIIDAAHAHVDQFFNKNLEDLLSLMVIDRYMKYTNPGYEPIFSLT